MKCQLCGHESLTEILDLGDQPICNAVLTPQQLSEKEQVYPLKIAVCPKCFLLQLSSIVSPELVFNQQYNYLTGSTPSLVKYFKALAEKISSRFNLTIDDLVIDIGSNDGTFLSFFKKSGIKALGIEPTPLPAQASKDKGICTVTGFFEYFTKSSSHRINMAYDFQDAKIVTAMNVIAHAKDIHQFLENVKAVMNEDGVFISQSHYLPALIEQFEWDTIYHEHLRYYTLTTLKRLFEMHGLYIFDAEINTVYGGSILVYASTRKDDCTYNVTNILTEEKKYQNLDIYIEFANQVRQNAQKLKAYLSKLKEKNKQIIGIGAPMKASTLLNYCKIGTETLHCITEVNTLKTGHFTPGTHIPIVDEDSLSVTSPDYALILSWNVSPEIMQNYRAKGYRGGFIIPIPEFHVINEVTKITDERGTITDVLTDEQIEHVNHITFSKGSVRGNHYHKRSIHYDYVVKGLLEVYTRLPWEPVKKRTVKAGDLIFTAPNERHAIKALRDSEIMVFTRGPRGGRNYEVDTYRLEGNEQLA
jgi:quercetin dioxygenase-like cupin family protein/SAM-dependent methyltransferase